MFDNSAIVRLYESVLHEDILKYKLNINDIRGGIGNMKQIYLPNPTSLTSETVDVANYNDAAHRCAYLHKYAPLHTVMVYHMINRALIQNFSVFQNTLRNGCLKLCSLGGGPGSDVLGVLAAMHENFGFNQISVTIVDCMVNWSITFSSIVQELRFGNYGTLGGNFSPQYFNWTYIGDNLLGKMSNKVNQAIAAAEIITMVKFVSAAACKDTYQMIKNIFNTMKPGAIVLYIDNAGGGFHQLMGQVATECRFITVFGPLKHEHYVNENMNIKRFGYTSCYATKISVHIWRKPIHNQNLNQIIKHYSHDLVLNQNEQNADGRRSIATSHSSHINNHQSQSSSMQRNNSKENVYSETTDKWPASSATMQKNASSISPDNNKSSQNMKSAQNISQIIIEQPKFMTYKPSSSVNRNASNFSKAGSASGIDRSSQQSKSVQNRPQIIEEQPTWHEPSVDNCCSCCVIS
ncbi:uncharacterized protein LOC118184808 [Stegodyphus dumicola]|uniref:uncharacterized protein LOC118184808 n=1 Tax=Stegodyphus dumicola TaxID=202533 RepID=UPI0015A799AA|nr:uncharacterized protein LOC118184808 [Stegodyphus dumicola]